METQEPEQLLVQALASHKDGQLLEAEVLYHQVLRLDSRNFEARYLLGLARWQQGDSANAIRHLSNAVKIQSDSAKAHHLLGLAMAAQKRFSEAISSYRRAIEIQPQLATAYRDLGNAYCSLGRKEEARSAYDWALKHNAETPEVHYNLGLLKQEAGCLEEAVEHYLEVLNLRREPPRELIGKLDRALFSLERFGHAKDFLERVLARHPDHPGGWSNLALTFQKLGKLDRAIQSSKRALEVDPTNADAEFNLGVVELLAGQFSRGWEHYEARWRTANPIFAPRKFNQPLWRGQSLEGRTLLIHTEQGFGDAIPRSEDFLYCPCDRARLQA